MMRAINDDTAALYGIVPLQVAAGAARAALGAERVSGSADPSRIPSRKALRTSRVNGVDGSVGVLDGRREFAGGEGVESAETGVHLGGGEAAVAEEPAEKIGGGTFAFERIAFEAAGNHVAVGIASVVGAGSDVIEALGASVGAAQAIETVSAFAEVDGLAQGAGLEEVELFEINRRVSRRVDRGIDGAGRMRGVVDGESARTGGGNLIGEASMMCPALLRWTTRSAPMTTSRRTDSRTGPALRPTPRASQGMEKWSWSLPSRRVWRKR